MTQVRIVPMNMQKITIQIMNVTLMIGIRNVKIRYSYRYLGLIRVISSTQLDDSVITRLLKFIVYALDQVLFALLTSQIIVSLQYALSL